MDKTRSFIEEKLINDPKKSAIEAIKVWQKAIK